MRIAKRATALGAVAAVTTAIILAAPAFAGGDSPTPSSPGMERTHERMTEDHPGMERMHEQMMRNNPQMRRMHNRMRERMEDTRPGPGVGGMHRQMSGDAASCH